MFKSIIEFSRERELLESKYGIIDIRRKSYNNKIGVQVLNVFNFIELSKGYEVEIEDYEGDETKAIASFNTKLDSDVIEISTYLTHLDYLKLKGVIESRTKESTTK